MILRRPMVSLNPCFNGISVELFKDFKIIRENEVLILVLMEYQ